MNRLEFMERLERLLSDIPESERKEAIQYYNDYLNDAGVENEEEVLEALQSPEKLAATIRDGLREESREEGEFSEQGFQTEEKEKDNLEAWTGAEHGTDAGNRYRYDRYRNQNYYSSRYRGNAGYSAGSNPQKEKNEYRREEADKQKKPGLSGGKLALVILLCIFAFPFGLAASVAIGGGILGVVGGILGGIFGVAAACVALVIAGVILIAIGIGCFIASPLSGIALSGAGLVLLGIGMLLVLLCGWVCVKALPAACRWLTGWIRSLWERKGGASA